jgi:hypothetical protein
MKNLLLSSLAASDPKDMSGTTTTTTTTTTEQQPAPEPVEPDYSSSGQIHSSGNMSGMR